MTYRDERVGVDVTSLGIFLNGMDVTARFSAGAESAPWQVGHEDYLPEGPNLFQATVADRMGNVGRATSIFTVATPTGVLPADLKTGPPAAARRAAIKLLDRRDDLGVAELRLVLKVVTEQRMVAARDKVVSVMLDRSLSPLTRAMAAAARSLGLTLRPEAREALEAYLNPPFPPTPSGQDEVAFNITQLVALQAVVRLSDDRSLQHNPPTWYERQQAALDAILQYLLQYPR